MVYTQDGSDHYVCAKFEVDSSLNSFKSYEGALKISKLCHVTISHAPFEP